MNSGISRAGIWLVIHEQHKYDIRSTADKQPRTSVANTPEKKCMLEPDADADANAGKRGSVPSQYPTLYSAEDIRRKGNEEDSWLILLYKGSKQRLRRSGHGKDMPFLLHMLIHNPRSEKGRTLGRILRSA